jgi:hypothetical protein
MKEEKTEVQKPQNLAQAICQVMKEVKSIEKNLTVGEGKSSYKGVADKDVKHLIGEAMTRAGLVILPIGIEPTVKVERWTEDTNYGPKVKQSVFTEVKTKYLLLHESGQSQEIVGYGHGVDSQDKSAGKATTYALKYALLYAFMVPTGTIDDADNTHSDSQPVKAVSQPTKQVQQEVKRRGLNEEEFTRACNAIDQGEYSIEALKNDYSLTEDQLTELNNWQKA